MPLTPARELSGEFHMYRASVEDASKSRVNKRLRTLEAGLSCLGLVEAPTTLHQPSKLNVAKLIRRQGCLRCHARCIHRLHRHGMECSNRRASFHRT